MECSGYRPLLFADGARDVALTGEGTLNGSGAVWWGSGADAMGVQASPLPDGRFATDWTVPAWAARPDGSVEPGVVWAAVDCTAAWWVTMSDQPRTALTAQLTVEVLEPLEVGATYALVGWGGAGPGGWDGRKRHAASAAFDRDGRCVARSSSFWLSVDTP